jgi:hypothetical protein
MSKLNYIELLYNYRGKLFSSKECLARKLKGEIPVALWYDRLFKKVTTPVLSAVRLVLCLRFPRNKVLQTNQKFHETGRTPSNFSGYQHLDGNLIYEFAR